MSIAEIKIEKIVINKLFGFLNHEIELKDGGVTFIHGPNGCGKTTILRMLFDFFGNEYDFTQNDSSLYTTKYENIKIFFDNDIYLKISKKDDKKNKIGLSFESFCSRSGKNINSYHEYALNEKERITKGEIEFFFKNMKKKIKYDHDNEVVHLIGNSSNFTKTFHNSYANGNKYKEWILQIRKYVNLSFIKTQRLLSLHENERKTESSNIIDIYSQELKDLILKQLAMLAAVSQSKDRSFPQRLLNLNVNESIDEQYIRSEYINMENKIRRLMDYGLVEEENISLSKKILKETEKSVLSLYIKDINEKYAVFDELLEKIETFLSVISPKLRNKSFKVNKDDGFSISSIVDSLDILKPSQLSSGEQHQIVLFYELIFKTKHNSFLCVDEPEISLHIDWQRQFLFDISKVANLGKHTFLIATHSPQIIGGQRHLSIALDGGILNE